MTTLHQEMETCFVCGQTHEYVHVGSTNAFGSPDLDTRPPEMQRSTMPYWVQRCPSCGYCAPDVSEGPERAREIIQSSAYRQQLQDPSYPELADSFLCAALIQEDAGQYADAGWAALHAAWACDDEGTPSSARAARQRAIALFRRAQDEDQDFIEGPGAAQALLSDLLRRSAQFDEVAAIYEEGLQAKPSKIIRQVLEFGLALAALKDARSHRIEEATEPAPPRSGDQPTARRLRDKRA
jgi:hypothetical protein